MVKKVRVIKDNKEIMPEGVAVKEVGLATGGGFDWSFERLLVDGGGWPYGISDEWDAYKKVGIVRTCINVRSHYALRDGFEVRVEPHNEDLKQFIDEMNWKMNIGNVINTSLVKRQVIGRCGWEVVWGSENREGQNVRMIEALLPLKSKSVEPHYKDDEPQTLDYYNYPEATNGRLDPRQALYFTLDSMDRENLGLSAVISLKDSINAKVNLTRDLLEASKRLWAPIGLFKMNTERWQDPVVKKKKMTEFAESLVPGKSLVYNTAIEKADIVDLKPDIMSLTKSLENVDQDIMGFWMIPKAILAREKTVTKATLHDAMEALYVGPVNSDQQYLGTELERQWYPKLIAVWKQWNQGKDNVDFKVRHIWKTQRFLDAALVRAFAYAVRNKVMSPVAFFRLLRLEYDESFLPQESQPNRGREETPESVDQQIESKVKEYMEDAVEVGLDDLAVVGASPVMAEEDETTVEEI